jgi:hypothetical protein
MLKRFMVASAATALLVGVAAAEGTGGPPAPAPSAPAPAAKPAPAPAAKSTEMSKPAPGAQAGKFISSQSPDQHLASNFRGTDVVGPDNAKIGDVSDILFAKDGKILGYVVSVGGFLGIGSKNVALEPAAFEVVAGDKSKNESDKLKLAMTKEQLQQAANFEPYKAPATTTTGMGGGTSPRPSSSLPR